MAANWSNIPVDILYEISKHLPRDAIEIARFSCVSKSWRSSALHHQKSLPPCAPLLVLEKRDNDNPDGEHGVRCVYSFSSKRFFNLKLPQAQGRRCWGTPFGWVLTMGLDLSINLLNPLSRAYIPLPPQHTLVNQFVKDNKPGKLGQYFLNKIVLSSNPSESNTPIALATYRVFCYLAMATPVDKVWTLFQGSLWNFIEDMIFMNGHFYVVNYLGQVGICDLSTNPPTATEFARAPYTAGDILVFYLAEISGHLHLIGRVQKFYDSDDEENEVGDGEYFNDYNGATEHFHVFKFDFHRTEWTKVTDLDNHALFIGNNQSFAISATDYPEFRGNCIYFADDDQDGYNKGVSDMGIYDIDKDMVEPFYIGDDKGSIFSQPFFFMPALP